MYRKKILSDFVNITEILLKTYNCHIKTLHGSKTFPSSRNPWTIFESGKVPMSPSHACPLVGLSVC